MPPSDFDVVINISPCNHVIPDDEGHETLLGTRHFDVDQVELTSMMRDKNMELLVKRFHGVKGLAGLLRTHLSSGLSTEDDSDIVKRREWFGFNKYTNPPPPKSLASFVRDAARDPIVVMLLVCAALALGFGVKHYGVGQGWSQGISVVPAVFLVMAVFVLSKVKRSRKDLDVVDDHDHDDVEVVRNGRNESIASHDVVVGDIVWLKSGVQVPADGLFFDGESLTLTDGVTTTGVIGADESKNSVDPFLFAGTKVIGGRARMLVTSVGMNTKYSEKIRSLMIISLTVEEQHTPLENRIREIACEILKFGLVVAALAGAFGRHDNGKEGESTIGDRLAKAFNTAVPILVVGMKEALTLAAPLALAHSVDKIRKSGIRVRRLRACENMGAATVMCADKTGVITPRQDIRVVGLENTCRLETIDYALPYHARLWTPTESRVSTTVISILLET